jgi:hypothetical protein
MAGMAYAPSSMLAHIHVYIFLCAVSHSSAPHALRGSHLLSSPTSQVRELQLRVKSHSWQWQCRCHRLPCELMACCSHRLVTLPLHLGSVSHHLSCWYLVCSSLPLWISWLRCSQGQLSCVLMHSPEPRPGQSGCERKRFPNLDEKLLQDLLVSMAALAVRQDNRETGRAMWGGPCLSN